MRSYRHAILALFLLAAVTLHGCGEDAKKEETIVEKIEDVKEEVQEAVQETVDKVTETVQESIKQVEDSVKKETPSIIASIQSSIKDAVTPKSDKPAPAAEKPASKPQGNPFDQLNGTPLEDKKNALFKMLTTLDQTLDSKIPEPVKKILMIVFPFIATAQALCNKLFPKPVDHMTVKERLVLKLAVLVVVPQLISVIVGFAEYKFTFGINKHPIKFSTMGSCSGSDAPDVCKDISDKSDIVGPWVTETVFAENHEGNVVEVEVYMLTSDTSYRTSDETAYGSEMETRHEDVFGNKCCTGPQCFVKVFRNQETKTGSTDRKLVVSENKCILTQCMASPLHTVSGSPSSWERQEMRNNSDVASIFPGCSSYKTQVNAAHAVGTVVKSLLWTLTLLVSAVSNLALVFFAIQSKVGQVLVFIPFVAISVGLGVVSLLASGFSILRPTGSDGRRNYTSGSGYGDHTGNDQFNTDVIFGTRNQSSYWEVRRAAAYTSVYVYCFYAVAALNVVLSTPDMVILGATLAKKK